MCTQTQPLLFSLLASPFSVLPLDTFHLDYSMGPLTTPPPPGSSSPHHRPRPRRHLAGLLRLHGFTPHPKNEIEFPQLSQHLFSPSESASCASITACKSLCRVICDFTYSKHCTSSSWHRLFPLPRMLFPHFSAWSSPAHPLNSAHTPPV